MPENPPTAANKIIMAIAANYRRQGFRSIAVPAAALLTLADRAQLEAALGQLLDDGDLVPAGPSGVTLHPSGRLALLSREVLIQWMQELRAVGDNGRRVYLDGIAAELKALTDWASTESLPEELAQRAAQLAGVLVTHTLDPRAMDLVAAHGGSSQNRLATLIAMGPRSSSLEQLLSQLRHLVATSYPR